MTTSERAIAIVAASMCVAIGFASDAAAQNDDLGMPTIGEGREGEIVSLFAPYWGEANQDHGWRIAGARIEVGWVECDVITDEGHGATIRLDHPAQVRSPEFESASFAISVRADPGTRPAALALVEAVQANDPGGFWGAEPLLPHWLRQLCIDGFVWCVGALLVLLLAAGRQLRQAPRAIVIGIVGVVVFGAVVRLLMAPDTTLGVWPYSRMIPLHRAVWFGRMYPTLAAAFGREPFFPGTIGALTFWFSVATPLAIYCHGSQLLDSQRGGFIAALVVAALPLHIRFSHSEVAFAPSIALSSLAFALAHGALKERARAWRWFAWIALPPLAFLAYSARPLNILFAPLLIATCLFLTPATVRPQRRWGVAALVAAPAPLSIWYNLRVYFGAEYASSAAPIELLRSTARAFFSFEYNTLIRPDITPPLLLIAGVIGSVWAWRAGRRRIVGFLVAWLTLFFATHTVAMGEIYMQARYHMHLVAPLALIATLGFDELLTRRSSIGIGALALVAISPVAHGSFIRDVDFDEQREYAFVRQARPLIPPGCTVLEFSGPGAEVLQHRFERFGMQIVDGERTRRFEVVEIGAPTGSDDPLLPEARALLLDPPECLVYFQGLECWSAKEPEESIAPACAAAVDAAPVALVEEVRFPTRIYNYSISLGYGPTLDELHLALYRVTAPPPQSRAD